MENQLYKDLKDYPSPAEVKVYTNGTWVDDAYRVDYNVSTPRIPLYDYTSKFYKDVAEGHTIVQGQLVINYRFPNYLASALEGKIFKDPDVLKELNESLEIYRDMSISSSEDKVRRLIELKRIGALEPAKQVTNTLYGDVPAFNGILPLGSQTKKTVISQRGILPFDIEIWYGNENSNYVRVLRDCVLIGEGQVISAAAMAGGDLSSSSMPIFEVYSFFAKSVDEMINVKTKRV